MGDRITMDLAAMTELGQNLQAIHDAFEGATAACQGWSELTGETKLAGAVETFADNWSVKREAMLENIQNMQAMVSTVVSNLQGVDADLAGSLTSGAPEGGESHG